MVYGARLYGDVGSIPTTDFMELLLLIWLIWLFFLPINIAFTIRDAYHDDYKWDTITALEYGLSCVLLGPIGTIFFIVNFASEKEEYPWQSQNYYW